MFPVKRRLVIGLRILILSIVMGLSASVLAADSVVTDVRVGNHVDKTRVVLEMTRGLNMTFFMLDNPYRVVMDFAELDWQLVTALPVSSGLFKALRYGLYKPGQSRIVLETNQPVAVNTAFYLAPTQTGAQRLVLDIVPVERSIFLAGLKVALPVKTTGPGYVRNGETGNAVAASTGQTQKPLVMAAPDNTESMVPKQKPAITPSGKRVVVIDAGHGGADPGAIGRSGSYEKHITLVAARTIKEVLEFSGRYTVVLTRNRDIFLPLRKRVEAARKANAELFISVHADSIKNKSVSGASVYTLSEKASDKEAALLAEKENKADLIAGIDLSTESYEITNILIDLAQREAMNQSARFAGMLVKDLQRTSNVLSRAHRFAGFAVLKAPDVPSVLIELGFLSNAKDEKNLRSKAYVRKIGKALLTSTDRYFAQIQQATVN